MKSEELEATHNASNAKCKSRRTVQRPFVVPAAKEKVQQPAESRGYARIAPMKDAADLALSSNLTGMLASGRAVAAIILHTSRQT